MARGRELGRDDSEMGERARWESEGGRVGVGVGATTKGVKIAFHREEQKDQDTWNIHVIYFVNV